ncbi:MAG: hypothetical protein QOI92_298, partial [Chloroflexota bacterium]|nr:hypothetical protein [Chloroflexota bacterium]
EGEHPLDVIGAAVAQQCRGGIGQGDRADARIRTADPFITNEVLYQLSYAGVPQAF